MSISTMQQLEAFAFWRRQLLAAPMGRQLWGLDKTVEAKLMNQAPLYALSGQKVDFYVEAPLCGQPQVDLSAQYFAEAFAEDNPLQGLKVEQEGDFFHFYAKALATSKRELLRHSNLYLEAEISNIGVLYEAEVDGWTDNWTLKYDGENDDNCKVNVTSRLYKPNQKNEYAFIYRPIDLNNPFPNRNAGVNWYDWYSIPANKERLKSSYSKKEYQVELDNQSVSKIKEDNKNNNYLNWTGINKETGKSDFIDKYNIVRIQEGGNP